MAPKRKSGATARAVHERRLARAEEEWVADPNLVKALTLMLRDAMRPRLIRTIPPGHPNAGAQEWEQDGAEEIAEWLASAFPQVGWRATNERLFQFYEGIVPDPRDVPVYVFDPSVIAEKGGPDGP